MENGRREGVRNPSSSISEVLKNSRVEEERGMEGKEFHELKIENGRIKLDDLKLKGVTHYEIKSSAADTTELVLKMLIGNSSIRLD